MKRSVRRALQVLTAMIVLALGLATFAGVAPAQQAGPETGGPSTGSWSFGPLSPQGGPARNWFVLDLQPGQVVRDSVVLNNPTDKPISFQFYAADAFNSPEGGAFAVREPGAERTDLGRWVTMASDAYTIQAGQRLVIPFEIKVPADATPGDHVGAMVAVNVNPEGVSQSQGVDIGIKRAVGIRVYARVAGPLDPQLAVEDINLDTSPPVLPFLGSSKGTLRYTVTNKGNVTLTPRSNAKVTGPFGGTVASFDERVLPEILPGQSVTVTEEFSGLPPTGPLTAEITVADGDVVVSREASELMIPWLAVGILLVLLAVLVYVLVRRRRRHDDPTGRPAPPRAEREMVTS